MGWVSEDLFPSKLSFFIFIAYMGLFINQGILVTASKNKNNTYNYNTVTVVLLTECLKLVASVCVYLKENSIKNLAEDFVKHKKVLLYYFVPASLYCLYNNLQFVNLAAYDPTTYFLLLQFRVVVTGIVFQLIFSKRLSKVQWGSLLILTAGCVIKEIGHDRNAAAKAGSEDKNIFSYINPHLILILFQVFSSCFAGVYNEYLLKDKGVGVHIMIQNAFMYVDSIVCNALVLGVKGDIAGAFTKESIKAILQPGVVAIMVNNAAIGITTSLFLRSLNSILKTFASALELMFTAVLCWIIFGIPVDIFTFVAIFIVTGAIVLYARHPVVNLAKTEIIVEKPKTTETV